MSFLRRAIPTVLALLLVGCNSMPYTFDASISAADAGDYTLVMSACEAAPGNGMDICRVIEGQKITQSWIMVLPVDKKNVGGEVTVFYRGLEKSYGITDRVLTIPWKDFFGSETWKKDFDGEALALVSIRFKGDAGVEEQLLLRGIAKLVVVKPSYTRLPIDSSLQSWQSECKIQYTAAGRSAVSCK
jgi:hypothetical protein